MERIFWGCVFGYGMGMNALNKEEFSDAGWEDLVSESEEDIRRRYR